MYAWESYHEEHYALEEPARYAASAARARSFTRAGARVLDFGCGNGSFLLASRDAGLAPEGVEVEASAIAAVRSRTGLPVHALDELVASGARFDLVHLGDVLEHLPYPTQTMRSLERLLRPAGLFFVEGPLQSNPSLVYLATRAFRLVRRLLHRDAPGTTPPNHLLLTPSGAQRRFFTGTLGYEELLFRVSESGWPYLAQRQRFNSPGLLVRGAIGFAAIGVAALVPGVPRPLGNRFEAVVRIRP